ncbi:MAG: HEAT repeat domain-containing protein [Deltaproteobacteria bacterium]|nr:HEAT repeat domain-containing protein [Deltaproteobacteria bacterium]
MDNSISIQGMLKDRDPSVRRDACESIGESGETSFIPALVEALGDCDFGVREAALNALTAIGGREVASAVAPLLRLDDASLRNLGIEILRKVGGDALDVISSLLNDRDDDVVKFAVDLIADIRGNGAAALLYDCAGHSNPNVRASVAVCLGRLKAQGSSRALLKLLNDPEEWVKFSAIEGVGLLEDKASLELLLQIVDSDSVLLKEAAVEAVSRIASPSDAADVLTKLKGPLSKGAVINTGAIVDLLEKASSPAAGFRFSKDFTFVYFDFFSKALKDCDRTSGLEALKGLGLLKEPAGLKYAFAYVNKLNEMDEETEQVLLGAVVSMAGRGALPPAIKEELNRGGKGFKVIVRALGELKSDEAVPLLAALMDRAAKHELREIVSALESIGSPACAEILFRSLESKDGHVRKIAARALATLAGEGAAEALYRALEAEQYRDVAEEMTDTLALIPSPAVKGLFCGLLSKKDERLREMGARGLGMIGDEEALKSLKDACKDSSPVVRKAAYRSMAKLGIPEAGDTVLKGLEDSSDDVKLSILKALGGWSGEKIKKGLLKALGDRNIWVRYHAVMLLGDLGENDNEDALIRVLLNDEAPVKAAAAKALGKSGSSKSLGALEKFIAHPEQTVRSAVEEAIHLLKC